MDKRNSSLINGGQDSTDFITSYLLIVISIVIISGNVLVLLTVKSFAKRLVADTFIFSLALLDITHSLTSVLLAIVFKFTLLHKSTTKRKLFRFLCQTQGWFTVTTQLQSVFIVTMITLERFIAVSRPFLYKAYIKPGTAVRSLLFFLLVSVCLSSTPLFGWGDYSPIPKLALCMFNYHSDYAIVIVAIGYTDLAIVAYCFIAIRISLKKFMKRQTYFVRRRGAIAGPQMGKEMVRSTNLTKDEAKCIEQSKRLLKVSAMVSFLFYSSWLPLMVAITIAQLTHHSNEIVSVVATLMPLTSSLINPLLYFFSWERYKRSYIKIIQHFTNCCSYQRSTGRKDLPKVPGRNSTIRNLVENSSFSGRLDLVECDEDIGCEEISTPGPLSKSPSGIFHDVTHNSLNNNTSQSDQTLWVTGSDDLRASSDYLPATSNQSRHSSEDMWATPDGSLRFSTYSDVTRTSSDKIRRSSETLKNCARFPAIFISEISISGNHRNRRHTISEFRGSVATSSHKTGSNNDENLGLRCSGKIEIISSDRITWDSTYYQGSSRDNRRLSKRNQGSSRDNQISPRYIHWSSKDNHESSSDNEGPSKNNQLPSRGNQGVTRDNQGARGDNQGSSRDNQISPSYIHWSSKDNHESSSDNEGPSKNNQLSSRGNQGVTRDNQGAQGDNKRSSKYNQGSSRANQGSSRANQVSSRNTHGSREHRYVSRDSGRISTNYQSTSMEQLGISRNYEWTPVDHEELAMDHRRRLVDNHVRSMDHEWIPMDHHQTPIEHEWISMDHQGILMTNEGTVSKNSSKGKKSTKSSDLQKLRKCQDSNFNAMPQKCYKKSRRSLKNRKNQRRRKGIHDNSRTRFSEHCAITERIQEYLLSLMGNDEERNCRRNKREGSFHGKHRKNQHMHLKIRKNASLPITKNSDSTRSVSSHHVPTTDHHDKGTITSHSDNVPRGTEDTLGPNLQKYAEKPTSVSENRTKYSQVRANEQKRGGSCPTRREKETLIWAYL